MANLEQIVRKNVSEKLPEILSLHGVSGREGNVQDYVMKKLQPLSESVHQDTLGNIIAHKKGNGKQKLMIAAHMDEIGLMIKYIDRHGYLFFEPIGGIREQNLYARGCEVLTDEGSVPGIVNSIHPGRPLGDEEIPGVNDFFIDVGANSTEDIKRMGIEVGQPVRFIYPFQQLGNKVAGTALDDRLLMFILIETLKALDQDDREDLPDIYAVFSVQEEVGSRGARTAAYQIQPDLALALDITMANDLPKVHESEQIARVDDGPAIKVMDLIKRAMLGQIVSKEMVDQLKMIAKESNIPYQLEVHSVGSTDGATVHLERGGIPTGAICLPCRYVHAYELASIDDIIQMTQFLYESVKKLKVK